MYEEPRPAGPGCRRRLLLHCERTLLAMTPRIPDRVVSPFWPKTRFISLQYLQKLIAGRQEWIPNGRKRRSIGHVALGKFGNRHSSVESHGKFKKKYKLQFPLLVDEDHAIAEKYGVWQEKSMYGRKYWGIERSTFVIDADGHIEEIWRKVRPKGHAELVAGYLEG